jgi:hypothetical protein
MPSGGVPGTTMGDPFGALAGLGNRPVSDAGPDGGDRHHEPRDAGANDSPADSHGDNTQPAAADEPPDQPPTTELAGGSTEVPLPDGTIAHAPDHRAAAAVRAALGGADIAEAYRREGIVLPPPGTPVQAPIAAADLMAGDVGVWKDHLLMALGDSKVLVAGQVEPQSSVATGTDFLGWTRPTADRPPPEPVQTRPPEPPAP